LEPQLRGSRADHGRRRGGVGHRAGFYETAGVLRDMFQNHLMQLLTLTAMEAPASHSTPTPSATRKVKVLRCVRPLNREDDGFRWTLRGQYRSYRDEPGVPRGARPPPLRRVTLHVDNWRWQGVPFYLRSGKAMSCRTTQIVIQFRHPPHMIFDNGPAKRHDANRLVIQIQPAEGIQLHFQTKVPDAGMKRGWSIWTFTFRGQVRRRVARRVPAAAAGRHAGRRQSVCSKRRSRGFLAADRSDPDPRGIRAPPAAWPSTKPGNWGPPDATHWMRRKAASGSIRARC
jgi:glucose-6-phosphate 1-dehydrogenase